MLKRILISVLALFVIAGMSVEAKKVKLEAKKVEMPQSQDMQFTLGLVQSSLREGMSQSEVISLLGAPNIVTRDSDGKDSWVYDKIYTEASSLNHDAGATIILAGWHRGSSRVVRAQKTITVIIKFDKQGCVENYTYHNSQF